jgi:EAL domain-containing protein (putative c-di-GMP-specific phosphodiesterase class I)
MSVNVSAVQLMDHDFPDLVAQILLQSGMEPTDLILEVTEGTLFNDGETAKGALGALMRRGVLVALDDFGTGFSSMTHLREFLVSQIKIDRSFVQGAPTDPVAKAILYSLAALGKTLGVSIVAEGVETEEQKKIVREAGCDLTQGFVYYKPKSAKALQTLMK